MLQYLAVISQGLMSLPDGGQMPCGVRIESEVRSRITCQRQSWQQQELNLAKSSAHPQSASG